MTENKINKEEKVSKFKIIFKPVILFFFSYTTVRSASVVSYRVGIVYRLAQVVVLAYLIGWELIHMKGYQKFDSALGVVTTKVKGQGFVPIKTKMPKFNRTHPLEFFKDLFTLKPNVNYKILDTADYIIPPSEYNSIFIMTNFIETDQSKGICDEELGKYKAACQKDEDCLSLGSVMNTWNGIPTGRCIPSSYKPTAKVCEVKGWCPIEYDGDDGYDNVIRNVHNYTIFIKNDVDFFKLNKKERNVLPNMTNRYISKCIYHEKNDKLCPVFQLGYILSKAEANETERYLMLLKGGVILVGNYIFFYFYFLNMLFYIPLIECKEIVWDCDYDVVKNCLPEYKFKRFDMPFGSTATASGFNFRFAHKFKNYHEEQRVLHKAFGLRFIINVSGTAGKFNIVPLMLTTGAGIGLMSLTAFFGDYVLLNCTKNKKMFQKVKELDLKRPSVIEESFDAISLDEMVPQKEIDDIEEEE